MIISHKHKFIFLKTRKTGGTSLEIGLSHFCGHRDIITPLGREDDAMRRHLGYPGPQNYFIPFRFYNRKDWINLFSRGLRKQFNPHDSAFFVRENIDNSIWNDYFKFSIERDPFDKAISRYFWSTRNQQPRMGITEYLNLAPVKKISNWEVYTINDIVSVDFLGKYEDLSCALQHLKEKIGLKNDILLPNAKGCYRKNRDHYSTVLDPEAKKRISIVCAKEIACLGYNWSDQEDSDT